MSGRGQKTPEARALKLQRADGHKALTNAEILAMREPMQVLLQKELPVRVSFRVAQIANLLNGYLGAQETVRNNLVKKYGTEVEGKPGTFYVPETFVEEAEGPEALPIPNPKYAEFMAEYRELLDVEMDAALGEPIVLPETLNGQPFLVEPRILMALEKIIKLQD